MRSPRAPLAVVVALATAAGCTCGSEPNTDGSPDASGVPDGAIDQNGGPDGGAGGDAGAGGWGGVGGEGLGGPVSSQTVQVLVGTPEADPGLTWLYPYDGTVWPQGILAPLLQWRNGTHDPDAVLIELTASGTSWRGVFARTATPFVHHPIPQEVWRRITDTSGGKTLAVRLVFAAGGTAWGPLTQTWTIAPGSLKGTVYYNSYGTRLAENYSGGLGGFASFGGATLAIKGGSTDPVLVAGKSGTSSDCRVCHAVSADGSTLITQHGDNHDWPTSKYDLRNGNAETRMSPEDGRFAWAAPSPDGTYLFSNSAPLQAASSLPSRLYRIPEGTEIAATGLPNDLRAGTPVFAHDAAHVAFNWYGGSVGGAQGDARSLAVLDFTPPAAFGAFDKLYTPPTGRRAVYPSFLPTNDAIVFEVETRSNGRNFAETRSDCDQTAACSDIGARAELWWIDLATKIPARLDRLNGVGYLPSGGEGHDDDATLSYESTVSPIASGGYAWVVFTSRRLYGNVATLNPYWSDPRFHDISRSPTTKKLWVAAVDLGAVPGTDPSHPAFYVPAQELMAGNSRGYWVVDPCKPDGEGCVSGDECCGGFCRTGSESSRICVPRPSTCSEEFESCAVTDDCCAGLRCVNLRCARFNPQ